MTTYLRVKKWRNYQHYTDRRPPWIKLLRRLIEHDRHFQEQLTELEQWQLVRLWLYASGSDLVMLDDQAREVPLIANDERTLRVGIRTAKRIPLAKFVQLGWLQVVTDADIEASYAAHTDPAVASTIASALASTDASAESSKTAVTRPPREKTEAVEELKEAGLPAFGEPVEVLIAHITDGDANTPAVIRRYADKLPPAAFGQCLHQLRVKQPRNQARYAVATLKRMVNEGQYAA